jgi:hypothetical protein
MIKTLGSGNLQLAVKLPEGEDQNEWIAVNTVDFFNQLNMLYGTLTEFCTPEVSVCNDDAGLMMMRACQPRSAAFHVRAGVWLVRPAGSQI